MTKEQFDSLYYCKAVHCDTEEKAKEFLALADSVGYKWFNEDISTEPTRWQIFKEDTHYFVKRFWDEFVIEHGPSDYYLNYNIDCIEFIPQSQKFKVGDKVRIKDTLYCSINGKIGIVVELNLSSPIPYGVKIDNDGYWLWEDELEKVEEPKAKAETTETLIDEIKAKWSEINILLNRLEKKKGN